MALVEWMTLVLVALVILVNFRAVLIVVVFDFVGFVGLVRFVRFVDLVGFVTFMSCMAYMIRRDGALLQRRLIGHGAGRVGASFLLYRSRRGLMVTGVPAAIQL